MLMQKKEIKEETPNKNFMINLKNMALSTILENLRTRFMSALNAIRMMDLKFKLR